MKSEDVCRHIERVGIVPVVRAPSAELAMRAAKALVDGGVSVIEITLTVPAALSAITALREHYGDRALIGAGSVLTAQDAKACLDAGACFIVSPGLDLETVATVRDRGIAMLAGALTPTEVIAAAKAGAAMIKIFPCSAVGGATYLRALRGPLPHLKLLPTGGVSLATAVEYIAAGAAALGMGSELVDIALLDAGRDSELTLRAQKLVQVVQSAREELKR